MSRILIEIEKNSETNQIIYTCSDNSVYEFNIQKDTTGEFIEDYIEDLKVKRYLIDDEDTLESRMREGNFRCCIFLMHVYYPRKEFFEEKDFSNAFFSKGCDFMSANFKKEVSFHQAYFLTAAHFASANFFEGAYFSNAKFYGGANFRNAHFSKNATFTKSKYRGSVSFLNTQFSGDALWEDSEFAHDVNFTEATFSKEASFLRARFLSAASFPVVNFIEVADFSGAQFCNKVDFRSTHFLKKAFFMESKFQSHAYYNSAQFSGDAFWGKSHFVNEVDFTGVAFSKVAFFRNVVFAERADFQFVNIKNLLVLSASSERSEPLSINLRGSVINNIDYTNTIFNHENRETAMILKSVAIKQRDQVNALVFYEQEMRIYHEELKKNKGKLRENRSKWIDWLILEVEKKVSDFGTNPWRAFLWLSGWQLATLLVASWCLQWHFPSTPLGALEAIGWLQVAYYPLNVFFIYEFVKSLRKFSRNL